MFILISSHPFIYLTNYAPQAAEEMQISIQYPINYDNAKIILPQFITDQSPNI